MNQSTRQPAPAVATWRETSPTLSALAVGEIADLGGTTLARVEVKKRNWSAWCDVMSTRYPPLKAPRLIENEAGRRGGSSWTQADGT